jgi:nucleolar GTP-binding protein
MERLTFASLAHLPTAVIFVIDPTGLSGDKSTFQAQLNVRAYLKTRFPRRPWIDVISKGDIEIPDHIKQLLPQDHISVSVKTGQNIDVLKQEIESMLHSLQDFLLQQVNTRQQQQSSVTDTQN